MNWRGASYGGAEELQGNVKRGDMLSMGLNGGPKE